MKKKQLLVGTGIVAAAVLVIGLLGYFVADRVIAWGTGRIMHELPRGTIAEGIRVTEVSYGDTSVGGMATAVWRDVNMRVDVGDNLSPSLPAHWHTRVEKAVLTWRGLFSGTLTCVLHGVTVQPVKDASFQSATRSGQIVVLEDFQLQLKRVNVKKDIEALSPTSFQMALGEIARHIEEWMNGQDAATPLELEGRLQFKIDGKTLAVGVQTSERNGRKKLASNPDDVRKAARVFGDSLTDAEAELAARFPMRIPGLLVAKTTAEQMGHAQFGQSRKGDAYRHLVWSWLLCEQFGPRFAKAVTAAHEQDSGNPPEEQKRDRLNNRLGRQYWEQGVPFEELAQKIRSASEVAL